MCGFKNCRKSGRCFLAGVSPCPEAAPETPEFLSKLGLNYEGFLEPTALMSALGIEAHDLIAKVAEAGTPVLENRAA